LTHQATAARSTNPATIGIHRGLGLGLLGPIAPTAVRRRDVRPDAYGVQVDHRLIAVIALVGDDLFQRLGGLQLGLRVFDLIRSGDGRFNDRRRITLVGALKSSWLP